MQYTYLDEKPFKMTTKLTLSLDAKIVAKAKKVAARKRISISKLVSNYFEKMPDDQSKSEVNVDDLAGGLRKGFIRDLCHIERGIG